MSAWEREVVVIVQHREGHVMGQQSRMGPERTISVGANEVEARNRRVVGIRREVVKLSGSNNSE